MSNIQIKDNWGHLTYLKDGQEFAPESGATVVVEFPDGTRQVVNSITTHTTTTVNDMGHQYSVNQTRYGFNYDLHGMTVKVDFSRVRVIS